MKARLICMIFCSALLCGCWDKRELNERAFVNGIALDKGESGFQAAVAVYDLKAYEGSAAPQAEEGNKNIKTAEGKSIPEALKKTGESSAQELFFGHTKAVILGEKLAKDKQLFAQALDALERDRELSRKNYVFISRGGADTAIGAKAQGEPSVGVFADKHYSAYGQGETFPMNLEELFIALRNCGNALVPKMSGENGELKLSGAAVIKEFALCGFLDGALTRGCLWQCGNLKGSAVTAEINGVSVTFTVLKHKKAARFSEEAGRLVKKTQIEAEGSVDAYTLGGGIGSKEAAEIEKAAEKEIEEEIAKANAMLQEKLGADAMDIKGQLKKKDYGLWLKYAASWEDAFKQMRIEPNVEVKIKSAGRIK